MKNKILSLATLLSALTIAVSCGGGNKPVDPTTSDDEEEHFATTSLHIGIDQITDTNYVFSDKTRSDYKVIADTDDDKILRHATFFRNQIKNSAGATLEIENPTEPTYDAESKYIVLGHEGMIEAAGVSFLTNDILGNTGYNIITKDQSIFVLGNSTDSIRLGVLRLLEFLVGYDMIEGDLVVFNKNDVDITSTSVVYLPKIEVVEKPDFQFRMPQNIMSNDARYGMGYTDNDVFIAIDGYRYHNTFKFVNPYAESDDVPGKTNFEAHRDWYCDDWRYNESDQTSRGQLCYTCHGNEDELELLIEKVTDKMIELAKENPELENITFTQQDCNYHCQCDACKSVCLPYSESTDNPANSVAIILFMNRLNDVLQEKVGIEFSEGRELHPVFFAYQTSYTPPKAGCGNVIHCDDDVGVIIAPVRASYTQSWWDKNNMNAEYANDFTKWSEFSNRIYCWPYGINFYAYMYPYASFDTIIKDYRFFYQRNGMLMMNEGQWEDHEVTAFGRLKDYIDAKATFNVNVNYNELVNKFFKFNYGEAGEIMHQMYDQMITQCRKIEEENPNAIVGKIHENVNLPKYWPGRLLKNWCDMADEALELIEKYRNNKTYYEAISHHTLVAAVSPYFMLATLYEKNYLTQSQLQYYRQKVADICRRYNLTHESEPLSQSGVTLESGRFINWGI